MTLYRRRRCPGTGQRWPAQGPAMTDGAAMTGGRERRRVDRSGGWYKGMESQMLTDAAHSTGPSPTPETRLGIRDEPMRRRRDRRAVAPFIAF